MEYLIETIVIMLLCITALVRDKATERVSAPPKQRWKSPGHAETQKQSIIKCQSIAKSGSSISLWMPVNNWYKLRRLDQPMKPAFALIRRQDNKPIA
ncbi:MAG TPA: hypothetical protein VIM77_03300 [Mucilaginibacter sp.]